MLVIGNRQVSIFFRMLLVFLLVFISLYLIGLWINIVGAGKIKDEIANSTGFIAENHLKSVEESIIRIYEMQGIYIRDHDFLSLANLSGEMNSVERLRRIEDVQAKLSMIKLSGRLVRKASVYMPQLRVTVNDYENYGGMDLDLLHALYGAGLFPLIYREGRLFLSPYGSSQYKPESLPRMNFFVELSIPEFVERLDKLILHDMGGAVLMDEAQGLYIARTRFGEEAPSPEALVQAARASLSGAPETVRIHGERYIVIARTSRYLNLSLLVFVQEKELLSPIQDYQKWMWIISLIAIAETLLFSSLLMRTVRRPLAKLLSAFSKADEGVLDISISHKPHDEFQDIYASFNKMLKRYREQIDKTYEQTILAQNFELKQLQNQINTHFLYNCFFLLNRLSKIEDYENIQRLTQHLASYYQFVTRNTHDMIPMEQEVEHARNYIEIQNFRFIGRITCALEALPPAFARMPVLRLILQPLIENCYVHGLQDKKSDGRIQVCYREAGPYLDVSVADNGNALTDEGLERMRRMLAEAPESRIEPATGLINIHRRIQLQYGKDCGLRFDRSEGGGLEVTLRMTIARQEEKECTVC